MSTVDIDLIEEWIEALEEGAFEQGRRRLRCPNTGKHCCLGVGASVAGVADSHLDGWSMLSGDLAPVAERLGLCLLQAGGNDWPFDTETTLAILNDKPGLGFDQIAAILRTELLEPLRRALA